MNRASAIAWCLLVLQPVLFYRSVLIKSADHIPYDLVGFHTPLADYISWSLQSGEFPLWDPNPYCGYPIHADVQAQLFYPPAWLAFLARNATGPETTLYWLEWLVAAHMMLAGVLTFWLLRKRGASTPAAYLAGVVFQLGAFFASQAQHLGAISGAAWLPLAWLAALELRERFSGRWFALLSIALALTFLAGFTAVTLVAFFSTGVVFLASRPKPLAVLWFLLAVTAVVPLTAALLFPAMQLSDWSVAGLRADWNQGSGTPLRAWMSLVWPNYNGVFHPFDLKPSDDEYQFTLMYCYSGAFAAVACLVGLFKRGTRVWILLAAAFAVLQCGNRLPGFPAMLHLLPGPVRGAVYADYFLAAACLAIAVGCGMVASRLPNRLAWLAGLATAVELILVSANRPMNTEPGSWKSITSESKINGDVQFPQTLKALLSKTTPPSRLDVLDLNFTFTMGASLRRLPTPNGDNPFAPRRVIDVRRLFARGEFWERQLPVAKPASPLLDLLNVRLLIADRETKENAAELQALGWMPAPNSGVERLYVRQQVQPRFFFVDRVRQAEPPQRALDLMQQIDLGHEAVVEAPPTAIGPAGTVSVIDYQPNSVVLSTSSMTPGFLVSSETYYPGWRAVIDGNAASIVLTNHAFRGMYVPAGNHRVEMRYYPTGFNALLVVTGLSWIVAGLLVGRRLEDGW